MIVQLIPYDNLLAMVAGSVGSRAYANAFGLVDGQKQNLTGCGRLSCAYFVSSVLKVFNLIDQVHLTVDGTVNDMMAFGWQEKEVPHLLDVLVWSKVDDHRHIGFYFNNEQAISTSVKTRAVAIHDWQLPNRRIAQVLHWPNF